MCHISSSGSATPTQSAYNGGVPPQFPHPSRRSIALIGAGPRGVSLIERIGANFGADFGANLTDSSPELLGWPLELHVIDDAESGAGRIWRTDQTRELCMNTLSHAVTLFTEHSSTVAGPIVPGPTLYEWSLLVLHSAFPEPTLSQRVAGFPPEHVLTFAAHPVRPGLATAYREELEQTVPESHPSRALYGEYLAWCYERAITSLPDEIQVIRHRTRAVGVDRTEFAERVALADGGLLEVDAVIIAAGWMERAATPWEDDLAHYLKSHPRLAWVPPASPVDQDLSHVAPGTHTIVRGLGMGFFDTMALLTIGRGGRFLPDPESDSGLRYEPSGQEPILHVTSRRGAPFRAKTLYQSLPPRPEQPFLLGADWSTATRPINFDRELWPRIVADAQLAYCTTLEREQPGALTVPPSELAAALEVVVGELTSRPSSDLRSADLRATVVRIGETVDPFLTNPADRFPLEDEIQPVGGSFGSPDAHNSRIRQMIADDLREAELGHASALKAGLWSISVARATANKIGTFGGFDAESRASGFALMHAIGGRAGSGPPAFRNRQLLALIDTGIVQFIGPDASLTYSEHGFTAHSPRVAGSEVTASTLIDAWMHFHDITESADLLTRKLMAAGRARPFHVASRSGARVATRGFDVDQATGLLVGADGTLDPTIHIAGIPVDDALHDTVISPMPGTDPPMLRETDRVARSALRVASRSSTSTNALEAANLD